MVALNVPYPGLKSPLWDDPDVMPPSREFGKWRWSETAQMWVPREGHWNFVAESRSWECLAIDPEKRGPPPKDASKSPGGPTIVVDDPCDEELVEIIRVPV
jgi:hypothetical protein